MENPKITVEIKHSESKTAWNIIGTIPGTKYKIARVPYLKIDDSEILNTRNRAEALKHAEWIMFCFNNSDNILNARGNF